MNHTEHLLRETLHDDSRALVPPQDLSQWVGRAVRRQRRVRVGAASFSVIALAGAAASALLAFSEQPPAPAPHHLADEASASPATPPELGRVTLPAKAQESVQECLSAAGPVREADLLARVEAGEQAWVLAGVTRGGRAAEAMFEQGPRQPGLLTVSCGSTEEQLSEGVLITQLRQEGGEPLGYVLFGSAPAGTEAVVLSGEGRQTVRVATHSAGSAWSNRAFFGVPWDGRGGTTATALDAGGNILGTAHEE